MAEQKAAIAEVEIIQPTALESITKGELTSQVDIAKRYPRDMTTFIKRAVTLATMDPEVAAECHYSVPRAGKKITGESVRLAEICCSTYGNITVAGRIIEVGETHVTAQGAAHDLESNNRGSCEVRRRITDRNGKRYSDDMINTTCNAAIAIARRNATWIVIPKALVKPISEAARNCARGTQQTIPERWERMKEAYATVGVTEARLLARFKIKGVEGLTVEHIEEAFGLFTAIQQAEADPDQEFPDPKKQKARLAKEEEPEKQGTLPEREPGQEG